MSNEHQMWDYTRTRLAPYGRLKRIENSIPSEVGTPDVYYRLKFPGGGEQPNFSGWLELKHLEADDVEEHKALKIPTLTLDQVMWLEDEWKLGGNAFLLLRVGKAFMLLEPSSVRAIYHEFCTYAHIRHEAVYFEAQYFRPARMVQCLKRFR